MRAEGAETFRRIAAQPTTLTEFLMRELATGLDLERSAEDRARLVHEAKPHLQKLAAPVLRVQLTKAVAQAAAMTQAEVEDSVRHQAAGARPRRRRRGRATAASP